MPSYQDSTVAGSLQPGSYRRGPDVRELALSARTLEVLTLNVTLVVPARAVR
jgi:hypothetical protein